MRIVRFRTPDGVREAVMEQIDPPGDGVERPHVAYYESEDPSTWGPLGEVDLPDQAGGAKRP
jgi:hypothetical protein